MTEEIDAKEVNFPGTPEDRFMRDVWAAFHQYSAELTTSPSRHWKRSIAMNAVTMLYDTLEYVESTATHLMERR